MTHKAETGFTARALQLTTGLSVDNSEAFGALSSASIRAEDLRAGRYDAATVRVWLVNWADPSAREEIFRGHLGDVTWKGAEFKAELRSLSDRLNQPIGEVYTRACSAALGDARCRFDLTQPGYTDERDVEKVAANGRTLIFATAGAFADRWFEGGQLEVLDGPSAGLSAPIRTDRVAGGGRQLDLWYSLQSALLPGNRVKLVAGCDKRPDTCRGKFGNFLNFRGFPHLPGDDWVTSYPRPGKPMTGAALLLPKPDILP